MEDLYHTTVNAELPKNPVPKTTRFIGACVQDPLGQQWRILSAYNNRVRLIRLGAIGTEIEVLVTAFLEDYVLLLDHL